MSSATRPAALSLAIPAMIGLASFAHTAATEATLDLARARALESVAIDLGEARIHVEKASLIPAAGGGGLPLEWALVGRMTFHLDVPDAVERSQLELFTGAEALAEPLAKAMLVIPRGALVERLLAFPASTPDPETVAAASGLVTEWRRAPERLALGVDAIAFRKAGGDPLVDDFFASWCHSPRLGSFFYVLDPREREPIAVRRFVPLDFGDAENERVRRMVRRINRSGRMIGLRFEDLGDLDTWVSLALRDETGRTALTGNGVEPTRYRLDVTLDPPAGRISGRARIDMESVRRGLRAFEIRVFPDLAVSAIRDERGRNLRFHQHRETVTVLLAEPLDAGAALAIDVTWAGVGLGEFENGLYHLRSTTGWYPHVGDVDRAPYEVTLRWPKRLELVAPGALLESGTDGPLAWERRSIVFPTDWFSFEVGDLHVEKRELGRVALTVGFPRQPRLASSSDRAELLKVIEDSFRFLEDAFGPYPADTLTIVLTDRGFSQGLLGFITLSTTRRDTVAHEIAHQWWGNKVGWWSYRDQWLSEALAVYASSVFMAERQTAEFEESESQEEKNEAHARLLDAMRRRSGSLLDRTPAGRFEVSLGPVTLGYRLDSSLSGWAYRTIVYEKGSRLISELGVLIGRDELMAMLRGIATAAAGQVIDTDQFVRAMEKMAGPEIGALLSRYVRLPGLANVFYEYRVEEDGPDRWKIVGTAIHMPTGRLHFDLERVGEDGWDVRERFAADAESDSFRLVTPYLVTYASEDEAETARSRRPTLDARKVSGFRGRTFLSGLETRFEIPSAKRPDAFVFDSKHETTAVFSSVRSDPLRTLLRLAGRFAERGEAERAESLYRRVLEPSASDLSWWKIRPEKGDDRRDLDLCRARAWVGIADLRLAARDEGGAEAAIEASKKAVPAGLERDFRITYLMREARIALRRGDAPSAFESLSKELRLEFKQREGQDAGEQLMRRRFLAKGRITGGADDYARLAIAAHLTGNEEICRRSSEEATLRGAATDALDALHGVRSARSAR